ncbi:MAG TPA: acyl-CoA dehydrogenase, partial [Methylomirabilota bacterium]
MTLVQAGFLAAVLLAVLAVVLGVPPARRRLVTSWVMPVIARALPRMGATERIALEAGTVWWDGELFSGHPAWRKLLEFTPRRLSAEERAF